MQTKEEILKSLGAKPAPEDRRTAADIGVMSLTAKDEKTTWRGRIIHISDRGEVEVDWQEGPMKSMVHPISGFSKKDQELISQLKVVPENIVI
ncbi:MAG: hypothetical protein ACREQV_09815, partial [Candidatus Binatia bacterium]